MNVVYVLSPDRAPLMPCSCAIARLLLKQGKAKVVRRTPFTIKLHTPPEGTYTQPLTLGIDTGSSVLGAAVADASGNVLYLSEVEVRNDIAQIMKERAALRRNRRQRKTRYRPPRWLNRKNSIKTGRFSPTMRSKIDAHLREIRFVQSLLPITSMVLETGTFDPHALKNPQVLQNKWLYQKGINYGYANTKAYVLARDGYTCQHCQGQSKESRLEVHHPVFQVNSVLLKKCVPDGDYQQTKGKRSEQRLTTSKLAGFRKFDKVRYLGQEYFIKGRMATGYAILMDIHGTKVALKPIPKFEQMERVSARSSWMISQKIMQSCSSSTTDVCV